jgi:hypothetical protein
MLAGARLHAGGRIRGERRAAQVAYAGPDRRAGAERH